MKFAFAIGVVTLVMGSAAGYGMALLGHYNAGEYFSPDNREEPVTSVAAAVSSAPAPQVLVVNGERHDFGYMNRNTTGQHTFQIKNAGQKPLTLEVAETTCKCTLSELESSTVEPGQIVGVTLQWEAKDPGTEFSQAAVIRTNDPHREIVRLMVEGIVEDPVRAVPPQIHLANIPGDQQITRSFRVFGVKSITDLQVESVKFDEPQSRPFFSYTTRPLESEEVQLDPRAGSGVEVTLTLNPGLPTGLLRQDVRVVLNTEEIGEIHVPVTGNVISDISIIGRGVSFDSQRNILSLGPVESAEGTKAELVLLLKGADRESIDVQVAEVDPAESLRATLGEPKKTDRLVTIPLTIEVVPGSAPVTRLGSNQGKPGTVRLTTSSAITKDITIHVRFAVR